MISEGLPTERFQGLPDHEQLAKRIIERLAVDEHVTGVFLSGSFAKGKPDKYSDLDFYIVVPEGQKETVVAAHKSLFESVGKLGTIFPATHLGDPNQIIAFYEGTVPLHVDYNYKVPSELTKRPNDKDAVILVDKDGELTKLRQVWQTLESEYAPEAQDLQYFEDRFWAWCWYTYSKIQRGELWEARDAEEYLRNAVLVKLAYYQKGLLSEGNRRLEAKFPPEILKILEDSLPDGHSRRSYHQSLLKLMNGYLQLFDEASKNVEGLRQVDRDYFIQTIRSNE